MSKLTWCWKCKENSCYTWVKSDCRVIRCSNGGCDYEVKLPPVKKECIDGKDAFSNGSSVQSCSGS